MKKLLFTFTALAVLSGTGALASQKNIMETDTTLVVYSGEYSKDFANSVNRLIKESNVKDLYKKRLEASARVEEKQRAMALKYKVDTSHKDVSRYDIVRARTIQAQQASDRAKDFIVNKSYKFLTKEACDGLNDAQKYSRAICKVKYDNQVDSALEDLDSIMQIDKRAYCTKALIRLMKNSSKAISDTTKDVILAKMRKQNRTSICTVAFQIASAKE